MQRRIRAFAYALVLALVGAWLFVPGLEFTTILRAWVSALLTAFQATPLGRFLPSSVLSLPTGTVLLATFAAVLPRTAIIAWRSYAFVRRRKRAARALVRALTA